MERVITTGSLVALAFFVGTVPSGSIALAQDGTPPAVAGPAEGSAVGSTPYFASVTADNVYVRSGPSVQSSYPFGKMDRGEVVRVLEENFGWARVQTTGRAFADMTGFVTVDDRVQLSTDSASITANTATELRAPNIGAESSIDSSWKQIGRIEAGATLVVASRKDGERGSVWVVQLPPIGEGWINSNFLRRSTAAEAANFEQVQGTQDTLAVAAPDSSMTAESESSPSESGTTAQEALPVKNPAKVAAEMRRATFADLEASWLKVKGQPVGEAELGALYARYVMLAAEPGIESSLKARTLARISQLEIQQDVQNKMFDLKETKARLNEECNQINGVAVALEARSEYTAVGVLNASLIYDGSNLPLLFRLQDPSSGQTVGYVVPGDGFQLSTMLGTLLGIKGDKCFDDALKVDTITPRTIDFLTARSGD